MKTKYFTNITSMRFMLFMLIAMLLFLPVLANAQVPTLSVGDIGIPGVTGKTSIIKTLGLTIGTIVFVYIILVVGFGFGDTIGSFFRQLNDSRKEGDWSPLVKFIAVAFVVLVIIFIIMGYINEYIFTPVNALK